jgi:hypothetical protein
VLQPVGADMKKPAARMAAGLVGLSVGSASAGADHGVLAFPGLAAVDRLTGDVAQAQPRQVKVGKLAVGERVQLFVNRAIGAVVGDRLPQAGEEAGSLGEIGVGVQADGVCHG